jgi:hypothetical protein
VTGLPDRRAVLELVRLPAALSVPGDVLLGAAASGALRGRRDWGRSAGLVAASTCLYLAGMALNATEIKALLLQLAGLPMDEAEEVVRQPARSRNGKQ